MTVTIRDVLSTLPSGEQGVALSTSELGAYLSETYDTQAERDRNARHATRDEIYMDGGLSVMNRVLDAVYQDPLLRDLRKKMVPYTRFNNALKRVVNELSSVYSAPAIRSVASGDEVYQDVLTATSFGDVAVRFNRLYNLHRAVLVGFRVRALPDGSRQPVVDMVSPASARAVLHPNDSALVVGWLIRIAHKSARRGNERPAAWALWTDHERVMLDERLQPIESTYLEHGFGVCPWVPIVRHRGIPGFWPGEEGEDLVSAQIALWLVNILMLKETKSATRQALLQGDLSMMARDQAMDTENPITLPDGASATSVDMSMDLGMFRDIGNHILESAASNYGLSSSVLKHQGVQSAEARDLMRVPLRELRLEQQVVFRAFERQFANVMAAVLRVDMPEMAFDPTGWAIDFGDPQTPLTPNEQITLFERTRKAGLDNTVDYLMRLNPDITEEQAMAQVTRNIELETWRNEVMRPLQSISGSLGADGAAATPAGDAPQLAGELDGAGAGGAPEQSAPEQSAPDAPADAVTQDAALNGAQVTAMLEVVKSSVRGEISRESAKSLLEAAFPINSATAAAVLGPDIDPPVTQTAEPRGGQGA